MTSHMLDHSKEVFIPPHNIFGKEVESTGGVVARIVEPRCVRGGGLKKHVFQAATTALRKPRHKNKVFPLK